MLARPALSCALSLDIDPAWELSRCACRLGRTPGAWQVLGPHSQLRFLFLPGSSDATPTVYLGRSLTPLCLLSPKQEAVKMEKKIRWMVMHSQVPGCFPAAAGLCCPPNNAIHATSAEAGQGERLRGREGASTGPRARYPRQEARLGSQGPVSRGLLPWQLRACSRPHH